MARTGLPTSESDEGLVICNVQNIVCQKCFMGISQVLQVFIKDVVGYCQTPVQSDSPVQVSRD